MSTVSGSRTPMEREVVSTTDEHAPVHQIGHYVLGGRHEHTAAGRDRRRPP